MSNIIKSTAHSRGNYALTNPRQTGIIVFDETCCLCNRNIPDGKMVLRHIETKKIICLLCLVDMAEIN